MTAIEENPPRGSVARRILVTWLRVMTILLVVATILALFARWSRWCDILACFQVQWLAMSLLVSALLVAIRSWRWGMVCLVCAVGAGVQVGPVYLPANAAVPASGKPYRVMLFNVLQTNHRYAEVMAEVERHLPDVLVVQECDETWYEMIAPLQSRLPHHLHVPGRQLRGMAVFSRLPLENVEILDLNNPMSRSVKAKVDVNGTALSMFVTHPDPPVHERLWKDRNEQLQLAGRQVRKLPVPRILIGDLNVTMWNPCYRDLIGGTGLVNVRQGFGVRVSFPFDELPLLRVPIDHILVSDDIAVTTCLIGESCGSDHAPIVAGLSLP